MAFARTVDESTCIPSFVIFAIVIPGTLAHAWSSKITLQDDHHIGGILNRTLEVRTSKY